MNGGTCFSGLCISWTWLGQNWVDMAFYSGLVGFVLLWIVVRLLRKKRPLAEDEVN